MGNRVLRLALLIALLAEPGGAVVRERAPWAPPTLRDAILGAVPARSREYYQQRRIRLAALADPTPEELVDLATAHFRLGEVARAIELLGEQVTAWPERFAGRAALATCLAAAGRLDEAIATLEAAGEIPAPERYELLLWRHQRRLLADPERAGQELFLGFDVTDRLGPAFRALAPAAGAEPRLREVHRRQVRLLLGVTDDWPVSLAQLLAEPPEPPAEALFAAAELLAAEGERALAWHAYQRARDRRHPREVDIPYYQSQLLATLPREERGELTATRHYQLRRRIVGWVAAYQRSERQVVTTGGDADDPALWAEFLREHPRP